MRVMTFNTLHCELFEKKVIDIPYFADYIKGFSLDICSLNEIRGAGLLKGYSDQTKNLSNLLSMHGYFGEAIKVQGIASYGNALLSKYKPKSQETIKIPDPKKTEKGFYESRSIIKSVFETDNKKFMTLTTHMGLMRGERINAVREIVKIVNETDMPIILMGDFNDTPDSEILAPLFKLFNNVAEKINGNRLSFPSTKPETTIDYILYRNIICENAFMPNDIVSDHLPIVADFTY